MSAKHLRRHVNEFLGRYYMGVTDTLDQLELTMGRMVGKRPRYRDLVRGNGLRSGARAAAG